MRVSCRAPSAAGVPIEVRICCNKTCRRQGSKLLVQLGKDLGLGPQVEVHEGGCLGGACGVHLSLAVATMAPVMLKVLHIPMRPGSCGNGPNVAVIALDGSPPILLHHVATPAKLAEVLSEVCGAPVNSTLLRATELRLAGNAAARENELEQAITLYTQALDLQPPAGVHLLLSNRSGARLAAGDFQGALQDADAAAAVAPPDFTTAAVRRAEALLALGKPQEAAAGLEAACAQGQPQFASSDAYRMLMHRAQSLAGGVRA